MRSDPRPSNVDLAPDFRDFIELLNAYEVSFVLVGGFAVGWYGVVRATGDIDFLYEQSAQNVERLCKALADFGAPAALVDSKFLLSSNAVTQIGTEPFRIDLLGAISGVSFAEVKRGAQRVNVDRMALQIIGLDELRKNKASTRRAKDKLDLRLLRNAAQDRGNAG